VPKRFISSPSLSRGSDQDLCLESTLKELPLYHFPVETNCRGVEVTRIFEKYPLLPGAILVEEGEFVGMISRQRLLEYLLRPYGLEMFLNKPLSVLYSYARHDVLVLRERTPILAAAQQAMRRSPELANDPIVVQVSASAYQLLDVRELNLAYWQIRGIETQVRYERAQIHMVQSEKMASLGRLVDGVAHEILDPVGFIWGNLTHVHSYSQSLLELMAVYEKHCSGLPTEIADLKADIELDFLQEDLPRAIASIRAGAERLKKLALSLQNFSHIDDVYPKPADLHASLDSILLLLKSRLSGDIQVIKNYGHLPPIPCFIGQLNQVFINILSNAIDALISQSVSQRFSQDFSGGGKTYSARKPCIEITTQVRPLKSKNAIGTETRWISIKIADNGAGISLTKQKQILDSFSVEKRAAKETSLGMSYEIVTGKHGGEFYMRSQPDIGSEFEILLPLV